VFVINGLLGGLTCALLHAKSWEEVLTYTSIRAIVLGAVAGYIGKREIYLTANHSS